MACFLEAWVSTEELQVLLALTDDLSLLRSRGSAFSVILGVPLAHRAPERELYRQKGEYECLGSRFCSGWGSGLCHL